MLLRLLQSMPKKQTQPKQNPTPGSSTPQQFLLKFIERNFQRREIDEDSFRCFNKLTHILTKELSPNTAINYVEAFATMVNIVLANFHELTKNRETYALYLQLLDICLGIFEKAVDLDLSKDICCQLLELAALVADGNRKLESFPQVEQKLEKIAMPKDLLDSESFKKICQAEINPPLISGSKYDSFISALIFKSENSISSVTGSFLSTQGENYLDSIFKVLLKCIDSQDYAKFTNILRIYLTIGDSEQSKGHHISILLTKILSSKRKVQFICQVFDKIDIQKFYTPNNLLVVCVIALDSIFTEKVINQKSITLLKKISKYLRIFQGATELPQEEKLFNLYNKVLEVLFQGKAGREVLPPLQRKARRNDSLYRRDRNMDDQQNLLLREPFGLMIELQQQRIQSIHLAQKKSQQPLKNDQIKLISSIMSRIFLGISKIPYLQTQLKQVYNSQQRLTFFIRLCTQNPPFLHPQVLQLILSAYIPLVYGSRNLQEFQKVNSDDTALIKFIKLRILEEMITAEKLSDSQIFNKFYKQAYNKLTKPEGTNFDFVYISTLHLHMSEFQQVLTFITRSCMQKIKEGKEGKSQWFRCTLAVIASILDLHHNIIIKISSSRFKDNLGKFNAKFHIQDFLSMSELKQNKLFVVGPRIQISKQRQNQLKIISNFVTELFGLGGSVNDLTDFNNNQENSYYYMIMIELCTVCMQKTPKIGAESREIQSIIKIRRNNKYSQPLTIVNQLFSLLRNALENKTESNEVIIMHMLIKLENIFNEISFSAEKQKKSQLEAELGPQKIQQIYTSLAHFLSIEGNEPRFQLIQLVSKQMQAEQQSLLNRVYLNYPDQIQLKKNKLKQHVKHFQAIKFYTEAIANSEVLSFMIIKTTITLLNILGNYFKLQDNEQQNELEKPFRYMYSHRMVFAHEQEKKLIRTYLKIRLICHADNTHSSTNLAEIKPIFRYLEQNHQQVATLLINQQANTKQLPVQKLFKNDTNFIGYLLSIVIRPDVKSIQQKQLSLLGLNLFQTVIINHSSVLQIARKSLSQMQQNSGFITELISQIATKGIQSMREVTAEYEEKTQGSSTIKIRQKPQDEEKIAEQNKKVYHIISKLLACTSMTEQQQQDLVKMLSSTIQSDDYSNIFVSVFIVQELISIFPILRALLSDKAFKQLAEVILQYLMVLGQVYDTVVIKTNQKTTNISAVINYFMRLFYCDRLVEEESLKLTDKYVESLMPRQEMKRPERGGKGKSGKLTCLGNQARGTYKCLLCESSRQFCINCANVCHKDHPVIISGQKNSQNGQNGKSALKVCLCFEQNCRISPFNNFKNKQKLEKKKEKHERSRNPFQDDRRGNYYERNQKAPREPYNRDYIDEEESWMRQLQQDTSFNQMPYEQNVVPRMSQGLSFSYGSVNNPFAARLASLPPQYVPPMRVMPGTNGPSYMAMSVPPPMPSPMLGVPPGELGMMRGEPRNRIQIVDTSPGMHVPPSNRGAPFSSLFMPGGMNNPDEQPNNFIYQPRFRAHMQEDMEFQQFYKARLDRQMDRQMDRQIDRQNNRRESSSNKLREIDAYNKRMALESRFQALEKNCPKEVIEIPDQQQQNNAKFIEEDYKALQKQINSKITAIKQSSHRENTSLYQQIMNQSCLLPAFMIMVSQLCKGKSDNFKQKEPEINWHLKLKLPIINNPIIAEGLYKICAPRTFNTRLNKIQGSFHPSPCVSRAPFAVTDKHIFILSGPKVSIHLRQQLYSYLLQKSQNPNNNTGSFPAIFELALHFQPHSISIGHTNLVCIAGLHNIVLYEYDNTGELVNLNKQLRANVNNDNINKIKLNKFGVFVGLSRQIRVYTHTMQNKVVFKLPDALIKQWCIMETSQDSFTIYVTASEGYIMYAQGTMGSSGDINLIKKVSDGRSNRPVGAYVLAKKVEDCGTLMLSSFKDKSIGHSLGRLTAEASLSNVNYLKLNAQDISPLFEKYNLIGLADLAYRKDQQTKTLYIVNIIKQQNNDVMAVHRGLLSLIRIKLEKQTGMSQCEVQVLAAENQRSQYFELIWLEDQKNWFVLALQQDGSLQIMLPYKIGRGILEKEMTSLRQRKNRVDRNDPSLGKNDQANPVGNQESSQIQRLCNGIRQQLNINELRRKFETQPKQNNSYLAYIQGSEILKSNQDFTCTVLSSDQERNTRSYELRLTNRKKIITGLGINQCISVVLPTRTVQNCLEIGFTHEESLYFYAYGVIRLEVRKEDEKGNLSRDAQKKALLSKPRSQWSPEDRLLATTIAASQKNNSEISAYGETLDSFKTKIGPLFKKIDKFSKVPSPFQLTAEQNLQNSLKSVNLFLVNLIESSTQILSEQDSAQFVQSLKTNFLNPTRLKSLPAETKSTLKLVIYNSLHLHQTTQSRRFHVFNDSLHPLRSATEKIIECLYQRLALGEITEAETHQLVNELYSLASGRGSSQLPIPNSQPDFHLLMYYIAKYPAMSYKLHKKVKSIDSSQIAYRLIPVYLLNLVTLGYLGYHLEWVVPALCEAVGKCIAMTEQPNPRPSTLRRLVLYRYLRVCLSLQPEPWLKNIDPVDAQQCLKSAPAVLNKNSSQNNQRDNQRGGEFGGNAGLMNMLYGAQDDMEDQQAMIKRAIELSQMESKMNQMMFEEEVQRLDQPMDQQDQQILPEPCQTHYNNITPVIINLVQQLLKYIDYSATNVQQHSQRAIVLYTLYRVSIDASTHQLYQLLCTEIKPVITKLCHGYQQLNNNNTNGNVTTVLMLWMNLFGMIYRDYQRSPATESLYAEVKEEIMACLNKAKLVNIRPVTACPNLFLSRLQSGQCPSHHNFVYAFVSVLKRPCEATFALLTLGCYWLFPHQKQHYNKINFIETVRECQRTGNVQQMHEMAAANLGWWREVGDVTWLEDWVRGRSEGWVEAIDLLAMYYDTE